MSMPQPPRHARNQPDAPGLKTRADNAKKRPGNLPGVQSDPRRTSAQIEADRQAEAAAAQEAATKQNAALRRVADIEDEQNTEDAAYGQELSEPDERHDDESVDGDDEAFKSPSSSKSESESSEEEEASPLLFLVGLVTAAVGLRLRTVRYGFFTYRKPSG
ncbi:hypothetical protein MVEN_02317500 [Mycena venus]|uniref:Uncharacterized protein n=1 Tax=Mycena venus TaxID=2733690 RepID=A0A8H6X4Q6_9AGAR|nr:hypothetical protein MVEN_02317500 [Mycena venus]